MKASTTTKTEYYKYSFFPRTKAEYYKYSFFPRIKAEYYKYSFFPWTMAEYYKYSFFPWIIPQKDSLVTFKIEMTCDFLLKDQQLNNT